MFCFFTSQGNLIEHIIVCECAQHIIELLQYQQKHPCIRPGIIFYVHLSQKLSYLPLSSCLALVLLQLNLQL